MRIGYLYHQANSSSVTKLLVGRLVEGKIGAAGCAGYTGFTIAASQSHNSWAGFSPGKTHIAQLKKGTWIVKPV